jgi:hypothetical protein
MLRIACAALALIATGCLGAASGATKAQHPSADSADSPTRLDYFLLASLADSRQPLSMASYRPSR